MFCFDKNVEMKDKIIIIITYILLCNFPIGIIFMFLLIENDYPRMHFNRVFFCGFLYFLNLMIVYYKIPIGSTVIPSFIGIVSILGMVQALFGERTQWFYFDRFKFAVNNGQPTKTYIQVTLTISVLILSIII